MGARSVLIIGGSGFVGTHLAVRLRDECKVFTTSFRHEGRIPGVTMIPISLDEPETVRMAVLASRAEVVVYAAGTPESASPKEIDLVHSAGPLRALSAASMLNSKFVLVSSSRVFDGMKGDYLESDAPLPGDPIGKAKLAAENGVRNRTVRYAILRSSPAYGSGRARKPSLSDRIIRELALGRVLELDDREVHGFTPVESLAEAVARACMDEEACGIFHHFGAEPCTELELGRRIARKFGLRESLLRPKPCEEPDGRADFTLGGTSGAGILKVKPLLLEQGLDLLEKQLLAARA